MRLREPLHTNTYILFQVVPGHTQTSDKCIGWKERKKIMGKINTDTVIEHPALSVTILKG